MSARRVVRITASFALKRNDVALCAFNCIGATERPHAATLGSFETQTSLFCRIEQRPGGVGDDDQIGLHLSASFLGKTSRVIGKKR